MRKFTVYVQVIAAESFVYFLGCMAKCTGLAPAFALIEDSLLPVTHPARALLPTDQRTYRLADLPQKGLELPGAESVIVPLLPQQALDDAVKLWLSRMDPSIPAHIAPMNAVRYRKFDWEQFQYQPLDLPTGLVRFSS